MLRRLLGLTAFAAMLVTPGLAQAQDSAYFGPQAGLFIPASETLRDALGENWFSVGASRIRLFDANQSKIAHDWNAIGQRRNGNSIFILTGSIGYVAAFGGDNSKNVPYAAIRGGLAYIDYAVDTPGGRESGKRIGLNANAAIGMTFDERVNVEVRYDVWNGYDGLTFNGLTLAVRVGLVRF